MSQPPGIGHAADPTTQRQLDLELRDRALRGRDAEIRALAGPPPESVFLTVQRTWALNVAVQLEDEESASDVACQDHVSVQVNAPEESGAGLAWIGDEGSDLTRSSGL